jgi:hypothetical protein
MNVEEKKREYKCKIKEVEELKNARTQGTSNYQETSIHIKNQARKHKKWLVSKPPCVTE